MDYGRNLEQWLAVPTKLLYFIISQMMAYQEVSPL